MTQLMYIQTFKKRYHFLLSTIFNRSQSALQVTDDSRMKDVLQRLLWLPVPREKKYDSNSLKTKQISLLKLLMRPESLYEKTIDL